MYIKITPQKRSLLFVTIQYCIHYQTVVWVKSTLLNHKNQHSKLIANRVLCKDCYIRTEKVSNLTSDTSRTAYSQAQKIIKQQTLTIWLVQKNSTWIRPFFSKNIKVLIDMKLPPNFFRKLSCISKLRAAVMRNSNTVPTIKIAVCHCFEVEVHLQQVIKKLYQKKHLIKHSNNTSGWSYHPNLSKLTRSICSNIKRIRNIKQKIPSQIQNNYQNLLLLFYTVAILHFQLQTSNNIEKHQYVTLHNTFCLHQHFL
eukprot:TRINITY_DN5436_c1_g2_i9.p1 TRINITY_DN5436_c1_g2~~TRINITY_DN5436_c1_g2_i9.p1  ORF type:complete len:255 (+),score=-27.30 TRINITY_DN5436_c1_g2_i9:269-1033(+)